MRANNGADGERDVDEPVGGLVCAPDSGLPDFGDLEGSLFEENRAIARREERMRCGFDVVAARMLLKGHEISGLEDATGYESRALNVYLAQIFTKN